MTRESSIERHLVVLASGNGWLTRKVRWIGRYGAPDRLLISPDGRVIWVELKAPGKTPGPVQCREHTRLRNYGQDVRVIDSLEGVEALFK